MIPPQISVKAPKGEQLIFRKLRDEPETQEWVVFHSFDIRRHTERIEGEADLVVVVPGHGVLCVEVKGCGVSRHDGLWTYAYNPPRTTPVGPFKQASDASHSLRKYIAGQNSGLGGLLFYSAVMFTEVDFDEKSLEWDPWQAITKSDLLRNPVSRIILQVLERSHSKFASVHSRKGWYGDRARPTVRQVEAMIGLMRKDFEYAAGGGIAFDIAEQSVRKFTEEQFVALDLLEENQRVLFKGPAGTGKTLLAIEAARRAVRSGKSALLLCYNSMLGAWLKRETASIEDEAKVMGVGFHVGTLSSLMLSIQGGAIPEAADSRFWAIDLPLRATDALLSDACTFPAHDVLIVDEAQDLLSDAMLDVLELMTTGGLSAGRWAMFGDFERQAIYAGLDGESGLERLRSRVGSAFTTSPLRINCRNSTRIAEAVTLTSGLAPGYSRVLSDADSPDIDVVFYRNPAHQVEQLALVLRRLLKKYPSENIVILSTRADAASCAAATAAAHPDLRMVPYKSGPLGEGGIRYASVHAFKGLEAAAVILTDIDSIEDAHGKSLLYVGMTRARHGLAMLINDRVRSDYDRLLMDGYKKAMNGGGR